MLPNWLYGKSKSKLQEILGGGGGTPADYNQVKAKVNQNTEDIALLNDTLDEKAALTQISNPNLLDNPWFTVNQRGFSTSNANGFTVDRWQILQAAGTVSLSNGAITIDPTVSGTVFLWGQTIEDALTKFAGKTLTLSILLSDGTIKSKVFKYPTSVSSGIQVANVYLGSTHYFEIYAYISGHARCGYFNDNGAIPSAPLTIKAAKLELGSVSTLAMDAAPNYATELLKCQRYFIGGKLESLYAYKTLGRVNAFMLLPVTMRSAPVIVGTAGIYALDDNSAVTGASIESPLELYSNGVKFPISGANDTLCRVFIASGSGLSAEL